MDQEGKQGEEEFELEVELLSRLHSQYLFSLLGYCSYNTRKLLVYEFMANDGLQEHLYPVSDDANILIDAYTEVNRPDLAKLVKQDKKYAYDLERRVDLEATDETKGV